MAYHNSNEEEANMKLVKLFPAEDESETSDFVVVRSNQTFSMEISPTVKTRANFSDFHVVDGSKSIKNEHENDRRNGDGDDEDQDDGIMISEDDDDVEGDDDTDMNGSWETENENYDNDEDDFSSDEYLNESTATTTTTKKPLTRRTKTPSKNSPHPHRRMYTTTSEKPKQQQSANPLSFMNFINFLKKIQNSFATRTAKTIVDKILILKRFRDSLIETINRQIESLWKIRTPNRRAELLKAEHKRKRVHNIQKRFISTGDEGGGGWVESGHGSGMAFPSAESALLSISFLTFAVFLIKLVLVKKLKIIIRDQI